jgi:hypothetical protein
MTAQDLPGELASELERKFFWWEHIGSHPRLHARILAQAMNLAGSNDLRHLDTRRSPAKVGQ